MTREPAGGVELHAKRVSSNAAGRLLLLFYDYDTQWGGDRSRSGGGQ